MEDGIATITETIPSISFKFDKGSSPQWSIEGAANGWVDVEGLRGGGSIAAGTIWAFQNSVDVSGWLVQDKSFFPMQAGIQEGSNFVYLDDDTLEVMDIISDCPLDVGPWCASNWTGQPRTVPALYQTTGRDTKHPPLGWENVLFGRFRALSHNDNLADSIMCLPVVVNEFGSMNPTATDRLYFTRLIGLRSGSTGQDLGLCGIPPSRLIIKGKVTSEDPLSYIFRLKDSFKITQDDVGYDL